MLVRIAATGNLIHCCGKLILLLWKAVWRFLKKAKNGTAI
jgi:hypothetical protein